MRSYIDRNQRISVIQDQSNKRVTSSQEPASTLIKFSGFFGQ